MHTNRRRRTVLVAVLALAVVALVATTALARVRIAWPEDDPGIPAYARFEAFGAIHTDEWAAIPFYRDPAYVPATFNLLDFFDFVGAFQAPLWVEGFSILSDDYATVYHAEIQGLRGMPVWFISTSDMVAAMQDGVVTMGELEALPSLRKGAAKTYSEVLHPYPFCTSGILVIESRGTVGDETFEFRFVETWSHDPPDDPVIHVELAKIEFK